MVVVVRLGSLDAGVVTKNMKRNDDARIAKAKQDIRVLESALSLYKLDYSNYPSPQQGLEALVQKPGGDPPANNWKAGGYIKSLPKDPWGAAYQYLQPGVKSELDIFSLGADGKPGGEGANADIGNWTIGS